MKQIDRVKFETVAQKGQTLYKLEKGMEDVSSVRVNNIEIPVDIIYKGEDTFINISAFGKVQRGTVITIFVDK